MAQSYGTRVCWPSTKEKVTLAGQRHLWGYVHVVTRASISNTYIRQSNRAETRRPRNPPGLSIKTDLGNQKTPSIVSARRQ